MNTGFIVAAQVLARLASTLFLLYVARRLGQAGLGEYAFAFGVLSVLQTLTDFGLGTLSVRDLARDRGRVDSYFTGNLIARLGLAAVAIVLVQAALPTLPLTPAIREMVRVLQLLLLCQAVTGAYGIVYNAFEAMHYPQALALFQAVATAALGATLLGSGRGVSSLAYAAAAVGVVNAALAAALVRRVVRVRWHPDPGLVLRMLRASLPFALTSVFALVYFRIGVFLLQFLRGPEAVGSFVAAFKILEAFLILPGALTFALFPRLARTAEDPARGTVALEHAARYLLLAAVPLAAATAAFAAPLLRLLYTERYLDSASCLRVLALAIVPLFLNSVLGAAALSLDRERTAMGIAAAMIGVNGLLHGLLIPADGIRGAAWATLITQTLVAVLYLRLLRRWVPGLRGIRQLWRPLAAGVPFLAMVWGPPVATFLPALAAYGCLLFLLRAVDGGDLVLLRRALGPAAEASR
ncbi:MAG: flippase [Acidobacteria bacterium]|nr:flippase [Acidobacteriota bacterium]